jgi:hypothetical protein
VTSGRRLRERRGAQSRLARAVVGRPPVAGESPGAVDKDAHPDALAVEVADLLDLAVLGRDQLGAPYDDSRVGVLSPGPDRRVDRRLAKVPHRRLP